MAVSRQVKFDKPQLRSLLLTRMEGGKGMLLPSGANGAVAGERLLKLPDRERT